MSASRSRARVLQALLALLALSVVALAALAPWRQRMLRQTEELERQASAHQAEAKRAAALRRAIDEDRATVRASPGNLEAQFRLARNLADAGWIEEAAQHADAAAALRPQDVDIELLAADVAQRLRRFDRAVAAYKAILRNDPENERAVTGLSLLYISFGWPRDADALLRPAVARFPANPYMKVALAMVSEQQNDSAAAERLLKDARALAPTDANIAGALAKLYLDARRYPDAIEVAQEILKLNPGSTSALGVKGVALYQMDKTSDAERALQSALASDPNSASARYHLALCYRRDHKQALAKRELETVLARAPLYEQTKQVLGRLYLQTGRVQDGQRLLAEAANDSARAQRHSRIGLVVASKPSSPDAHLQMAQLYQEEGQTGRMIVELQRTLALDPRSASARSMLDQALAERP